MTQAQTPTPEQQRHDWALLAHAANSAERTSFARRENAGTPPVDARSAAAGGVDAGLVPFKTSGEAGFFHPDDLCISFDEKRVRETRVKSLRKNVWSAGKLLEQQTRSGKFRCWFVTLTYRGVDDWRPRHLSDAIRAFRHWCKQRGCKPQYTWVAELQQRGAVHYHLAIWLPAHLSCPMWDRATKTLAPFWPHGMTNRAIARNAVGYLMKYMSKVGAYHVYPKGCRIYGAGGLESENRSIRTWLNLPTWVKQLHGVGEVTRRQGRLLVRETGEILQTPYRVLRGVGCMLLRAVRPVPGRWVDGPYSAVSFDHA